MKDEKSFKENMKCPQMHFYLHVVSSSKQMFSVVATQHLSTGQIYY